MMLCPLRLEIDPLEASSPAIIDADMLNDHVRVEADVDAALLDRYLQAAVLWAEGATKRTIISRSHTWVLRWFNVLSPYEIRLPRGKTTSIESVAYSQSGTVTTLSGPTSDPVGTDYQEDLRGDSGGVIMPARGSSWPSVDTDVPAPVVISFTAGWQGDDIPSDLLYAIMFAVADCYELRASTDLGSLGPRFDARHNLVSPYDLTRVY